MVKILSKQELSPFRENMLRLGAIIAALCASAGVIYLLGANPLEVYAKIIEGSLGTAYRFRSTVNKAIPLGVLSLGTLVAFRLRYWNIGAEGQFYMGAFAASLVAFRFPGLSMPALLGLMAAAGFAGGGLWALVSAVLRVKCAASETLVTLMLNYIALKWISYLQYGPWKDPAAIGFPKITPFVDNAVLPNLLGIHIGWVITLVLMVLISLLFKSTKLGYEIDVLGESEATAMYAGIGVKRVLFAAVMLSGGLCGFAGMMQASAIEHSLSEQLSGGLGFTSVITAWLARLDAVGAVAAAFLFSMLIQGGSFLQSALQIPSSMGQIIQGIIIFFVLAGDFFVRYRFAWIRN
ncbi:MAG: ABC transporter permease [Spirochaetaceae bacterium]|jgi:simple sugar transport system permease protein|nr:ABC transporter permease [Spirochaetaceae bacterium]